MMLGADHVQLHMDCTGAMDWLRDGIVHVSRRQQRAQLHEAILATQAQLASRGVPLQLVKVRAHRGGRADRCERVNQLCDRLARDVSKGDAVNLDPEHLTQCAGLRGLQPLGPTLTRAQAARKTQAPRRPTLADLHPHDRCVVCGLPSPARMYCPACSSW